MTQGRARSLKETLKKCMLKPVRVAAGLGNPPNKFVNQRTESLNTVIKEALVNKKLDQVSYHDIIYDKVFKCQEEEIMKAFIGSGEYRPAPEFSKYALDPVKFAQMTSVQKRDHFHKIFKDISMEQEQKEVSSQRLSVSIENSEIKHVVPSGSCNHLEKSRSDLGALQCY